jgi:hypothetical protein
MFSWGHIKVPIHTKKSIYGFLSWTQRILRIRWGGASGTLVKGQGSPGLMSRLWGTKGLSIRPGCIGTIRALTQCVSINESREVYRTYSRGHQCGGTCIIYQTHTHSYLCTQHSIPLHVYSLCSRPHACCLSVSHLTVYTLQFSLALLTALSVFKSLDIKISWLGGWASQWCPPHIL